MRNHHKFKSNPSDEGFWDEESTKIQIQSLLSRLLGSEIINNPNYSRSIADFGMRNH
jgi:hypothetical protein